MDEGGLEVGEVGRVEGFFPFSFSLFFFAFSRGRALLRGLGFGMKGRVFPFIEGGNGGVV